MRKLSLQLVYVEPPQVYAGRAAAALFHGQLWVVLPHLLYIAHMSLYIATMRT